MLVLVLIMLRVPVSGRKLDVRVDASVMNRWKFQVISGLLGSIRARCWRQLEEVAFASLVWGGVYPLRRWGGYTCGL